MKLIYIFHSGFTIEADGFAVLIDYFKDTEVDPLRGYVHDVLLRRPGHLYVLSSHSHPDHFNPEVLKWKQQKKDITYIFSRDILHYQKAGQEDALYLMKGDEFVDENLRIKAFGSTDIGISFRIEAGGKKIYHAGDLNNWHWKDESTPEEIAKAEKDYLNELELLAKSTNHFDLVMFPVDPRLGTDFSRGAKQFIDRIHTGLFVPMHFGEWYNKADEFKEYAQSKGISFMDLTHKGQTTEF